MTHPYQKQLDSMFVQLAEYIEEGDERAEGLMKRIEIFEKIMERVSDE